MPKICLNMIVKNEAARIERCLASVLPHITGAVIMDTGSTDDTVEIVRRICAQHAVPVDIWEGEFHNFSQARNDALNAAKMYALHFGHDAILLMDADMEFVGEHGWFDRVPFAEVYTMVQRAGSFSYHNIRMVRPQSAAKYIGVTHEYIGGWGSDAHIATAFFNDHADGANRTNKYERDIALLEEDLKVDPNNERSWFYLAQSYRDAGKWEQARDAYTRRVELGGWPEEVYMAMMGTADAHKAMGHIPAYVECLLQAYNFRPTRGEALHALAHHYRESGANELATMFAGRGMDIKRPDDKLFMNDFIYEVGFKQEFSIAGFYTSQRARAQNVTDELALDPLHPGVRDEARRNMFFYLESLEKLCPSFKSYRIEAPLPEGYVGMNPSIACTGSNYMMILRAVNYHITPWGSYDIRGGDGSVNRDNPIDTQNFLLRLAPDFKVEEQHPIKWERGEAAFPAVIGMEDMRLFRWQKHWYAFTNIRESNPGGWCVQHLVKLDFNDTCTHYNAEVVRPISRVGSTEKNWMPMVDNHELKAVYRLDTIIDLATDNATKQRVSLAVENISGGGQAIRFDGGWLCVVHEAGQIPGSPLRFYQHRFAWLDHDERLRRLSRPFVFHDKQIEFAAGLARAPSGEIVVSYGVRDEEARVATLSKSDVRHLLGWE